MALRIDRSHSGRGHAVAIFDRNNDADLADHTTSNNGGPAGHVSGWTRLAASSSNGDQLTADLSKCHV